MLLWSSCQREGVGLSHRLRQRWIGLCGHATGAPAGASYTAGRAVLRDRPASPCRQQFQREKSSLPWHSGSHEKSQLIQRLPAPLLRHRLATPRREELSAGQAARELDLSRTRFYKLYSPYRPRLRSRSRRHLGARPLRRRPPLRLACRGDRPAHQTPFLQTSLLLQRRRLRAPPPPAL